MYKCKATPIFMLLCMIMANAIAQTPTFNEKAVGICDSLINSEWENNMWVTKSYLLLDLNNDDYLSAMRQRDAQAKESFKLLFTRDANNRSTEAQGWVDLGSGLVHYSTTTFTYNGNGLLTNEATKTFFPIQADVDRIAYTYDGNGHLTGLLRERYMSGSWVNSYKETFTNNAGGKPLETIEETWDDNTSSWYMARRSTSIYNTAGNEISELVEVNQTVGTPNWTNDRKYTISYDINNKRLARLAESWINNAWENSEIDSSLSNNGSITYYWENNMWEPAEKSECAATQPNNAPAAPSNLTAVVTMKTTVDDKKIKLEWNDNSNNEDGFIVFRSTDNANWDRIDTVAMNLTTFTDEGLAENSTFYYRLTAYNSTGESGFSNVADATTPVSIVENMLNTNWLLYPNPANNTINIQYRNATEVRANINILNLTGQTVYAAQHTSQNISIDVSKISAGSYILVIQTENGISQQKIVINK